MRYRTKVLCTFLFLVTGLFCSGNVLAIEASQIPDESELYKTTPPPLTAAQCGQCHSAHFKWLQEDGLRHRIQCQRCHERFHAFNPQKNNWAELMPKCSQCHTQVHGAKHVDCLSCHMNPHTPRQVPMAANLASSCGDCHSAPAGELAQFPSAHTQQPCSACHHDRHGLIPSCMECHEPHVAGQDLAACKSCHPVHKPLQITYTAKDSANTCGSCHGGVYDAWSKTQSKHGKVHCAQCHPSHGEIPECTRCHAAPHDKAILGKFPRCLDCHLDVHDLPTSTKKK